MKLDILAFAAHPDDIELSCAGTLAKQKANGSKIGIIDLTRGELGTRGSAEIRDKEATLSAKILNLDIRENLRFRDGFFSNDETHQLAIIQAIRKYKPEIVLCNAVSDRHPDHGKAAQLVSESCFLAGLKKIETFNDDMSQEAWRPRVVYHYIQDNYLKPDFVIDITDFWEIKKQSILAFSSQFYNPDSKEPITPIATKDFMNFLEARARQFGRPAGYTFAEGFTVERTVSVDLLSDLK